MVLTKFAPGFAPRSGDRYNPSATGILDTRGIAQRGSSEPDKAHLRVHGKAVKDSEVRTRWNTMPRGEAGSGRNEKRAPIVITDHRLTVPADRLGSDQTPARGGICTSGAGWTPADSDWRGNVDK